MSHGRPIIVWQHGDRMFARTLSEAPTPSLILSVDKLDRNLNRMKAALEGKGVSFRPHLKTAKSVDVAARVVPPQGAATVSTLKEAEVFAAAGVQDLLYAVGIAPQKLPRVSALSKSGINISVLIDSVEQAEAVSAECRRAKVHLPAFLEIDCDGHRSGMRPDDAPTLLKVARALTDGAELRGVLTHAGLSYESRGAEDAARWAERERLAAVSAADVLRQAGYACPAVSVGATPTALHARDLSGVTEVRAGVFMFFDLVQTGIGVCGQDDIALSVLATVIGDQRESRRITIDAGWMALSRDRGTAAQEIDQGYGIVCDLQGVPFQDLLVLDANQEHGVIGLRPGSTAPLPELPVGARVRILPNHACATAAQHDGYLVVEGRSEQVSAYWPRFHGW